LIDMGRSSFTIQQEARIPDQTGDSAGQLLCTGSVRIGWINHQTMKPARIPTLVQDALKR
jgi:acyl-CoA thioester hydrolase